jgi:hypothetical protein
MLPDQPGWNEDDSLRVLVTNHAATPLRAAFLEIDAPSPLVLATDSAGRIAGTDTGTGPLTARALPQVPAGGSVSVWRRLHTPPAPVAMPGDSVGRRPPGGRGAAPQRDTVSRFPLRVRVRDSAAVVLAEVEDTLRIRAGSEVTVGGCGNAGEHLVVTRFGIGPVRVGMPVEALRSACPEARDSSWKAEGTRESGVLVLPGGVPVLAVTSGGRVSRIVLDRPGLATASGGAVGDDVGTLRERFGRMCAGRGEGRVAIWFPNAPGLSFGLDTAATRGWTLGHVSPDSISDQITVSSLWVRSGSDDCPARPGEGTP